MSAMTLRLPDEKYQRLKDMAHQRGQSLNRLLDEVTTLLLAEFDAETRFMLRAGKGSGNKKRGLLVVVKGRFSLIAETEQVFDGTTRPPWLQKPWRPFS